MFISWAGSTLIDSEFQKLIFGDNSTIDDFTLNIIKCYEDKKIPFNKIIKNIVLLSFNYKTWPVWTIDFQIKYLLKNKNSNYIKYHSEVEKYLALI